MLAWYVLALAVFTWVKNGNTWKFDVEESVIDLSASSAILFISVDGHV